MIQQQLCDAFFNIHNLVTVSIRMPAADWTSLRNAEPHGGRCARDYIGDRYDWYEVPEVVISGSDFPGGGSHSFSSVGVRKRSYCGSFSRRKPSLALNFGKFKDSNENLIEDLIGTKYVTLNNSRQDPSFIRQILGYEYFRRARLPHSRCNFARVLVNNDEIGIYVNIEPIKEPYIQHNFVNHLGNLYEIESREDLTQDVMDRGLISFEGLSQISDGSDLKIATRTLHSKGASGLHLVLDTGQFVQFLAMEILLKHWDGYSARPNNAYLYNDVQAVPNPGYQDINFKFLPWGLDQILQETEHFREYDNSVIAKIITNDPHLKLRLRAQIRRFASALFDRRSLDSVMLPLVGKLENILLAAGQGGVSPRIASVRQQLARAAERDYRSTQDWQAPLLHMVRTS